MAGEGQGRNKGGGGGAGGGGENVALGQTPRWQVIKKAAATVLLWGAWQRLLGGLGLSSNGGTSSPPPESTASGGRGGARLEGAVHAQRLQGLLLGSVSQSSCVACALSLTLPALARGRGIRVGRGL